MADVGGVHIIASLIAQEIRKRGRSPIAAKNSAQQEAAGADRVATKLGRLQRRITDRLVAIEPSDPDRYAKGLRVFLELVLVEELGSDLIEDPAFVDLLASVHGSMLSCPELAEPIRVAMSSLFMSATGSDLSHPAI